MNFIIVIIVNLWILLHTIKNIHASYYGETGEYFGIIKFKNTLSLLYQDNYYYRDNFAVATLLR